MYNKEEIINLLKLEQIDFTLKEHIPVYTIDEMKTLKFPRFQLVAKNLFVRDDKKRNYELIVVSQDKTVNLKELQSQIQTRRLSFASENDLNLYLGLKKGSVTPLGMLNDENHRVRMWIDTFFKEKDIGIHPMNNDATIWLKSDDLVSLLKKYGHHVEWLEIKKS